jgi:hypothetical protein
VNDFGFGRIFMPIYAKFPKFMIFYDIMPTGRPEIFNFWTPAFEKSPKY